MKPNIKTLLCVTAVAGMFAIPNKAFTQNQRNYDNGRGWWGSTNRDARDLQGRWYLNGDPDKPTEINMDHGRLEATNEDGKTSRLDMTRYGNVRAYDWHDLRGDVKGDRIEWSNGTTWTRRPSERIGNRYDRSARELQGRWYMNGDRDKPAAISMDNGRLMARNENGQTSRLEVDRYGNVRAPEWRGLRGDVRGNRIQWDNGTVWTRSPTENIGRR